MKKSIQDTQNNPSFDMLYLSVGYKLSLKNSSGTFLCFPNVIRDRATQFLGGMNRFCKAISFTESMAVLSSLALIVTTSDMSVTRRLVVTCSCVLLAGLDSCGSVVAVAVGGGREASFGRVIRGRRRTEIPRFSCCVLDIQRRNRWSDNIRLISTLFGKRFEQI